MSELTISVFGLGYVGLSVATLLAQHHKVIAVDTVRDKVDMVNERISPVVDEYLEKYFKEKRLNLTATTDGVEAIKESDYVVIATPTNYDAEKNFFDTSAVESVLDLVFHNNPTAVVIIKSTIPVGYTESVKAKYGTKSILFSPEFLRESKALYDNLFPSRIIVSVDEEDENINKAAHVFADLLKDGAQKKNVKLFSNTYLA